MLLNEKQLDNFAVNGFLVIHDFYDYESEIKPIQKAIYRLIGLVINRYRLDIDRPPFDAQNFDAGLAQLIQVNRTYGGEIYDAVKQIPAFLRLVCCEKGEELFAQLRDTDTVGIGQASYGIRIDHPNEEHFRSQWHQEFIFQPQSIDGLVMWSPLVNITKEMGPMMVCAKSHKDGLRKCSKSGDYKGKSGAYKIGLCDEQQVVSAYEHVAPLTKPGDLIIMDYLTLHQSGYNLSNRARWSVQSRFFNFKEPVGIQIGWKPSVTAGTDVEALIPEYFSEERK